MSTGDIYDRWKKMHSRDDIGEDFVDDVMTGVRKLHRSSRAGSIRGLLDHRYVRIGFIAGGAVAGAVRLGCLVFMLLGC